MSYFARILVPLLLLSFVLSCSPARRSSKFSSPEIRKVEYEAGNGDAYLYDIKIQYQGKKRSIRLDLYRKDSSLSLFARAYLGKGVLKGLITPEKSLIYFPTEKEYFNGRLSQLMKDNCADGVMFESILLSLIQKTPSEIESGLEDFIVTVVKESGKEHEYRLSSINCSHEIQLDYIFDDGRFILDEIDFELKSDSVGEKPFRFKAERRQHKLNIKIPESKMTLSIPDDAVEIII